MLTARGFWFLTVVIALAGLAIATTATALGLIALTLLGWFLAQWWLFQWRGCRAAGMRVERSLRTARGPARSLWAGERAEMRLVVTSRCVLPYVRVCDRLPSLARWLEGDLQAGGSLSSTNALELAYSVDCPAPGQLRFAGAHMQLADVHGFFSATLFIRQAFVCRVLPRLATESTHPTFVKQHNVLPLLGTHRQRRPGSGSELLELRDYVPGDPPKLIAWKASARRGRLMTKEFESEVPIRCTLFIDTSNAVRLGPVGASALTRLVEIAAAVAQAAATERDLVGLCVFDETGVARLLRPGRGPRHWLGLLDALTEAASLLPQNTGALLEDVLPYAYGLAEDAYPDLLASDVNAVPLFGPLFYRPQAVMETARGPASSSLAGVGRLLFGLALLTPLLPAWLAWRLRPSRRRLYRRHKQLAALLAVRYDLGPGGLAWLLEDAAACAHYAQRFLAEHQVATPQRLYDHSGRYLFRNAEKVLVLAQALLAAVGRAKDNELFVLCVDLLEAGAELDALTQAALVALARHHQLLVLCPWPASVPLPSAVAPAAGIEAAAMPLTDDVRTLVLQASTVRLHQAFVRVRQAFGRIGIPVVCAAEKDGVDLILQRLQRLRVRERGSR